MALAVVLAALLPGPTACSGGNGVRPAGQVVTLPAPSTRGTVSVEQALAARRSVRVFTSQPLTRRQVAQLLWAGQGENRPARRTAPSAGALYPVTLYAVVADEVLQFLPSGNRAQVWQQTGAQEHLGAASSGDPAVVRGAPVVLVVTVTPARTRAKYGSRGVRYADLEAGHAAQNVLLQAVALGLGAVVVGGFDDDAVARALTLPGGEEPRYLVPVGHPAG
ncbi:MAG: SagB/ThcOx family dehydrogenase [Motilibacteraceae bacterium]